MVVCVVLGGGIMEKILRLDAAGEPTAWINREDAANLYVKSQVIWDLGEARKIYGGINAISGRRSAITVKSLIATRGSVNVKTTSDTVTNAMLFRRDGYCCMYCGKQFNYSELTRDHIMPRSRGGSDTWVNLVAACERCNNHKADRTPEEAGMALLAIPFKPNIFEAMYLSNRRILADQMDYLEKQFSSSRNWQ
ncbi:HNH endonuclease [Alteromonadaceae bacterium 2753L.S.0a.02]|nr:HNH endonuclease [Alteromonadaceae bacterium 2753L.S.0a.02]